MDKLWINLLYLTFLLILGDYKYWIVCAIELSFAIYAWLIITGVDMSMGLCALYYVGEVRLLSYKFKNLRVKNNYRVYLKPLILRHCELLKYHHTLEEIYGLILLYVIIVCAVNLCISIYQVTFVSLTLFFYYKVLNFVVTNSFFFTDD